MKISSLLRLFKGIRILVIGDIVLDRYIWGKVSRISPEAPVPIVEVTNDSFLLGGAANVANNIVALGGRASVTGVIGNDRAGEVVKDLLRERNIELAIFEDSRPTTVKTRVIAHNQQVVRFDKEDKSTLSGKVLRRMIDYIKGSLREFDAVILSDYKKGVISKALIGEVLKVSKPAKKFLAVDPKVGHFHLYKGVSIITPNLSEAAHGSGIEIMDEDSLVRAGRVLLKKLCCEAVLITRGEEGMTLFANNKITHIPTVARHVYDVTGAGDTVIATFTLSRAAGATLEESAMIANHAAGIVVGEVGTAAVTPDKLRQSLKIGRYI